MAVQTKWCLNGKQNIFTNCIANVYRLHTGLNTWKILANSGNQRVNGGFHFGT